jgi:DNA invertase Pin-like site-specific DNA recombinase
MGYDFTMTDSGVTRDRAGLDRIRDIAQVGEIDTVIVCSLDRLARDVNLLCLLEEELQKRGIEIHCTQIHHDDTLSGYLHKPKGESK